MDHPQEMFDNFIVILPIKNGRKQLDLFSRIKKGEVLDFPAGKGDRSIELAGSGYHVIAADLFPCADKPPGLPYVLADANVPFPFRDRCFDCILSREGIEHLENQAGFIRECARVLKPGGKIVLTTPNVLHLNARHTAQRISRRNIGYAGVSRQRSYPQG